jgi:hypothetical protein
MTLADFSFPASLRRTVHALARVVCPPDLDALGIGDAVVDHLQLGLRAFPAHVRAGFVAGLAAAEVSSLPFHGRRFSRLAPAQADAHFTRLMHVRVGTLRAFAMAVRALLSFAYYEQPAVRAKLGYDPDAWVEEVKRRRLDHFGDELQRHERMVVAPDPLVRIRLARKVSDAKAG